MTDSQAIMTLDIGIFAHNEAEGISDMLSELARQDVLVQPGLSVRVHLLANGCSDDTVKRARAAVTDWPGAPVAIYDLTESGKSRTWNRFVHDLSRPKSDALIFCDADIRLPQADAIRRMVAHLDTNPHLCAVSSQPVKDLSFDTPLRTISEKLIAAAGGTLHDWKTAICGQLYLMPTRFARRFHLPVGLAVEDGFVRAMVATDVMTGPTDLQRLDGVEGVFHIYASERTISALVRHQVRVVIGSAVNAEVFAELEETPDVPAALARAAEDPSWLPEVLQRRLPRRFGWVDPHFAIMRLKSWSTRRGAARKSVLLVGLVFDLLVYFIAQAKMARGTGAGHW